MDTDLEESQIEVKLLVMRNDYGREVNLFRMGPLLIANLTEFKQNIQAVAYTAEQFGTPAKTSCRYIMQDRDGYISCSNALPKIDSKIASWCDYKNDGSLQTMQDAFVDYMPPSDVSIEFSLAGIVNERWRQAVVPKPFLFLALAAIERWYHKNDTSGGSKLSHTPYSIAMRMYIHKRKLKSISKGGINVKTDFIVK